MSHRISLKALFSSMMFISVMAFMLLHVSGCGESETSSPLPQNDGVLTVGVSVPPQGWLVEQIAGNDVRVVAMLPTGESLASYEPPQEDVIRLAYAKSYFFTGLQMEKASWFGTVAAEYRVPPVDLRSGVVMRDINARTYVGSDGIVSTVESTRDEANAGFSRDNPFHYRDTDPYIWTSPKALMVQAKTIADELKRIDAENAEGYDTRLASVLGTLESLDTELSELFEPMKDKTILVMNPTWGYLSRDYGLQELVIEFEGDAPSDAQLAAIKQIVSENGIQHLFVSSQNSNPESEAIALVIGVEVVELDLLAADVVSNLRDVATKLVGD